MSRSLDVLWEDVPVGVLRLDANGDMRFAYAASWLADPDNPAISVSLPLRSEEYDRRDTRPFFAGLLPEEAQRDAAARAVGVSKGNDFALLDALGGDVAGALALWPTGEDRPAFSPPFEPQQLGEDELADLIATLPRRPFLVGEHGLRMSLAGAQIKLPVVMVDGKIALPAPGQPTTHILKPPIERFEGTTENEAFAMRLAAALELPTARAEPRRAGGRPFLLVERYDRWRDPEGAAHRLHQEDFCQALGISPETKYASEGGPGFKQSFELIRQVCTRPAVDVLRLLDAAIYNAAIGNADAHGKNFSLLYQDGATILAPLYDLMSTALYPEVSSKLAMKIAKMSALEDLDGRTWAKFAQDMELGAPYVRRRVASLASAIPKHVPLVKRSLEREGFAGADLERIATLLIQRAGKMIEVVQAP